jgi:hypothetical protein
MAALASNLERNIVGRVALDLEGTGRQVVEVLVEKLDGRSHGKQWRMRVDERNASLERLALGANSYVVCRLGNICECWDRHDV